MLDERKSPGISRCLTGKAPMTKAANTDVSGFTSDRSLRRTCLGLFVNASPQNKRLFDSRETTFVTSLSHREDFVTRQRPHTFCMHLPSHPTVH